MTHSSLDFAAFGFAGYFAAFALFHLTFYGIRPAVRENLWFGVLAGLMAGLTILYSPIIWEAITWTDPYRIWVPLKPAAVMAMIFFVRALLGFEFRRVERTVIGLAAASMLVALLGPGRLLPAMNAVTDGVTVGAILVFAPRLLALRGRPLDRAMFAGIALFMVCVFGDVIANHAGLGPLELVPGLPHLFWFGFFGLVSTMGLGTAVRWATAEDAARTDQLTGLARRHVFEEALEREAKRIVRTGAPAVVAMLDMDDLKLVNDRYGHAAGDAALQAFGGVLRATVRSGDVSARLGGDEFAVLLIDTDMVGALVVTERIRAATAAIRLSEAPAVQITCSVGLAPVVRGSPPSEVAKAADRALYGAKGAGRNQVAAEGD